MTSIYAYQQGTSTWARAHADLLIAFKQKNHEEIHTVDLLRIAHSTLLPNTSSTVDADRPRIVHMGKTKP